MDNSKKTVHNSGPLGMLMKAGLVKRIKEDKDPEESISHKQETTGSSAISSYFKTDSGIQFKENELIQVDPQECAPWSYANRSADEMGDIDELMESIKSTSQLQPALVRNHPHPTNKIKYEVIFGRRRLEACLRLGIRFLVIKKDHLSDQEAIVCQHSENKLRSDVSNYSNAILYKKLLENKTFANEKELAQSLKMSTSNLSDILAFARMDSQIQNKIPNIHQLPIVMAVKIVRLSSQSRSMLEKIKAIADKIGSVIKTPAQLEKMLDEEKTKVASTSLINIEYKGSILGNIECKKGGTFILKLEKALANKVQSEEFLSSLKNLLIKSGAPDLDTK